MFQAAPTVYARQPRDARRPLPASVSASTRETAAGDELRFARGSAELTPGFRGNPSVSSSTGQTPQSRAATSCALRQRSPNRVAGLASRPPSDADPIGARAPVVSDVILRMASQTTGRERSAPGLTASGAVTEVARDIGAAGFVDAVDNAPRHGERARVGRCGWTTRASLASGFPPSLNARALRARVSRAASGLVRGHRYVALTGATFAVLADLPRAAAARPEGVLQERR
jgi:hypothetical protein